MNDGTDESADDACLLSDLAYEFTRRWRAGERPSVDEFVERYPHLADDIFQILPTLLLMEATEPSKSSPRPASEPTWKLAKLRLGDYRILREVGRGGMGVVYEAVQESLNRRVALKVLPPGNLAATHQLERFRREARAAAELHHPNIVPVFGVGEADGVHYYSMQFIDGQPLNNLLGGSAGSAGSLPIASQTRWRWRANRGVEVSPLESRNEHAEPPLPNSMTLDSTMTLDSGAARRVRTADFRFVAGVGKQVAHALAYAHRRGVLHRDIKPANLILDDNGAVWITDFGLARIDDEDDLTSPGDVVGTLRYLPPERFEGHLDQRGDLYSLGVTLYELLTLRSPFSASSRAKLIDRILNAAPLPLRRINPRIPRDLETIVLKAMAREPTQRYATASALADDLERFLTGRAISARRRSAWGHTWRWCRRNKSLAAAAGLVAMLVVSIFALALVDSVRIRSHLDETRVAQRDARERLFESLVSQAHARWMGGSSFGRRFETLGVVREARQLARELNLPDESITRLRTEAIAALCLPDEAIARTVDAFPPGSGAVAFDPNLQRYARGAIDGSVTIHQVSDNRLLHRLPGLGPELEMALWGGVVFSPDGDYLQQRCRNGEESVVRMWDVSGAQPRLAFETSSDVIGLTAFAPDGRHLGVLIRHRRGEAAEGEALFVHARILDLATGCDVAPSFNGDETSRIVFHPSETQLALSDTTGVRIVQWNTGAEVGRWNHPGIQPMAWSRDGRQLAARSLDENEPHIYRWDVPTLRELSPLEMPAKRRPETLVFSHRGNVLLSAQLHQYQLWEFPSGRLLSDCIGTALPSVNFSRDDRLLIPFGGVQPRIRFLQIADGLELRRLPLASPVDNGFPRAVMSHDGRLLAATSNRGTVLLDLETFEELALIPGSRIPLGFNLDGALLTRASAPEGVALWPIGADASALGVISVGSPQSLSGLPADATLDASGYVGPQRWSASRDGRVIAAPPPPGQASRRHAEVFVAESGDYFRYRPVELGPQHEVRYTSVSPDGTYVATGSLNWWAKPGDAVVAVTVWDAQSGQKIKDLVAGEGLPEFSPDGKWIAVTTSESSEAVRLWRVGSWRPAPMPPSVEFPGQADVAFDWQSRLVAVQGSQIRLLAPQTGREIAWLSVPEETSLAPQCFTPDGTKLVAYGLDNGQLYIWDLRAIRGQLAELGLDWDAPPYD